MKGFVIYPAYKIVEDRAYVLLYGRLENGESFCTVNYFRPYFYIKKNDLKKAEKLEEFEVEENGFKTKNGEEVVKIILNVPGDVPRIRRAFSEEKIKHYEADIRFPYRFLIDNNINGCVEIEGEYLKEEKIDRVYNEPKLKSCNFKPKLKILSIDIETDIEAKNIYCISMICGDFKKVLIVSEDKHLKNSECFSDEGGMLQAFVDYTNKLDPDVITGWNVIGFDLKIIAERCKKLDIDFKIGRDESRIKLTIEEDFFRESKADVPGRVVLDALRLLKISFIKVSDYKLDTVSSELLGEKKAVQFVDKGNEIEEMYTKNQQKLVDYNLKDSELVLKIIEKTGVVDLTIQRSMLTGMPPDRVNASIASFDSLYIKETRKRKLVVPTSDFVEKSEETTGGYVRESEPGIYDYLVILDFKSLYPSIIRTFNIDPMMLVECCPDGDCNKKDLIKLPMGACFKREEGILPSIIAELWKHREEARKNKNELARYAIKILMNSFYGVLASASCRFFSPILANAITKTGHFLVKLTAEKINEQGYKVIYNDSISKNRFVTLMIGDEIKIKNIEKLFEEHKNEIEKREDKEVVNLSKYNIKTLTLNKESLAPEFSRIKEIIRHKTDKKIFRINQKYGETVCTEDHSIMVYNKDNKLEMVKPQELENRPLVNVKYKDELKRIDIIDLYEILKDYECTIKYKGNNKISKVEIVNGEWLQFGWMEKNKPVLLKRFIDTNSKEFFYFCRLLGFYIAEGSSSTKETTSRVGASIANSDVHILEELEKYYSLFFKNVDVSVIPSTKKIRKLRYKNNDIFKEVIYQDKTHKLQLMNGLSAVFFKMLCGQGSSGKCLPSFIFHVDKKYQVELLKYMLKGDGGNQRQDGRYSNHYVNSNFSYTTKSLALVSGLTFLLGGMRINYSIQYRPSKKAYTIQTSRKNNIRLKTKITEERYFGYVYDLNVEDNYMFVDSCGQVLLHNTDSEFVVSKAKSLSEAEKIGVKLQDYINDFYPEYIKKEFGQKSYLELEYDKCFVKCIMPMLRGSEGKGRLPAAIGAKKRYAGLLIENGKEKIDVTGMEAIRGDWTELAKKYQYEILDRIFHNKDIIAFTKSFISELEKGKYDDLLIYKKSLRKGLEGYAVETPHKKAAKKIIAGGGKLDSSTIKYIMTSDGPEPVGYVKHKIDYKHYIEKQIKPIAESVLVFFKQDFDDIVRGNKQKGLGEF